MTASLASTKAVADAKSGRKRARREEYVPRSVLVTGGLGFIGSHLVCHLVREYPSCRVVNLDKVGYCASERNIDADVAAAPNYTFCRGNILDTDRV